MKMLLFLLLLHSFIQAQITTTFAGGGSMLGDGGPATSASISDPIIAVFDKIGNCYVASGIGGNRIRKIDTGGIITTIVGIGSGGYSGDGLPATSAKLRTPCSIAFDTIGNLFICDEGNNAIRKVDASTGIITTIAGNGTAGYNGDGILAISAFLNNPNDICFDKHGNLYIADANNSRVRKIDAAGIITTIAGNGTYGFSGDDSLATNAKLWIPLALAIDDTGNIYISDESNFRIRKVNTAGIITTFAGNGTVTYIGDGIPALSAQFNPAKIALDSSNNLYICDFNYNYRVLKVDNAGIVHSIAGNGVAAFGGDNGPATAASFYYPAGASFDPCGNLYVTNINSKRVRKVAFDTACNHNSSNSALIIQSITSPEITIFPNPAATSLAITSPDKITQITITNLIGHRVYTQACHTEQVQVSVASFPAGMYFVKVNDNVVRKFVKE